MSHSATTCEAGRSEMACVYSYTLATTVENVSANRKGLVAGPCCSGGGVECEVEVQSREEVELTLARWPVPTIPTRPPTTVVPTSLLIDADNTF